MPDAARLAHTGSRDDDFGHGICVDLFGIITCYRKMQAIKSDRIDSPVKQFVSFFVKVTAEGIFINLQLSGKLNSYLADIDNQAEDMGSRLVKQMAEREGITEQFKAENQMEWVRQMNNIRNKANETVLHKPINNV